MLTCCRLPFFVISEKAIFGGCRAPWVIASSAALGISRGAFRRGKGTSNVGLRSDFRASALSDTIFASSRSNSASASGSRSSSCRVTMTSSKSESAFSSPLVAACSNDQRGFRARSSHEPQLLLLRLMSGDLRVREWEAHRRQLHRIDYPLRLHLARVASQLRRSCNFATLLPRTNGLLRLGPLQASTEVCKTHMCPGQ